MIGLNVDVGKSVISHIDQYHVHTSYLCTDKLYARIANYISDIIHNLPYKSYVVEKIEKELRSFLSHLFSVVDIYRIFKRSLVERYTKIPGFSRAVPIPRDLRRTAWPHLFHDRYKLVTERLESCGLLHVHSHYYDANDISNSRCKAYSIRLRVYREAADNSDQMTDLADGKPVSWEMLLRDNIGLGEIKHDLGDRRNSRERQKKQRFVDLLDRLAVGSIDYRKYMLKMRRCVGKPKGCYIQTALRSNLVRIIRSGVHLEGDMLYFQPTYKLAEVGSRLYDPGQIQNIKRCYKKAFTHHLYDYDFHSCQMSILKHLFSVHKIECEFFDHYPDSESIKRVLKLKSKDTAKTLMYGVLFNVGVVCRSYWSRMVRDVAENEGRDNVDGILSNWNMIVREYLATPLGLLHQRIVAGARGGYITNAVKQPFKIESGGRNKRQALSHILQGEEQYWIHRLIEANPNSVCFLEHDGVKSYTSLKVPKDCYMDLVLKNQPKQPRLEKALRGLLNAA